MPSSLEKLLNTKIDVKELKKAERLLKSGELLFANTHNNYIQALFKDKSVTIRTKIELTGNGRECNCNGRNGTCLHEIALALHYLSHYGKPEKLNNEKTPSYSGLKLESLNKLSSVLSTRYEAKIELNIINSAPHAPSKWEKCNLAVKVKYQDKEYSGNIGNLRQLNFNEGIGCGVNISQFHPQDRQIIRFLAINAEADGRNISITAEAVAEFFHCLSGFNRCFVDGIAIFVHRDTAEPVLLYRKMNNEYALKPALITEVGTVTLKNARMILGRAGCWISVALDYWWVPGNLDLVWLRNFLRTKTTRYNQVDAEKIMAKAVASAIRIIDSAAPDTPYRKKCNPLYHAEYNEEGIFELQLDYCYGDTLLSAGGSSVSGSKKATWKRDRKYEKQLEDELVALGFIQKEFTGKNIFTLESKEASGIFLDQILPQWLNEERDIYLSAKLANLISGKTGIKQLVFNCLDVKENESFFDVTYSIAVPNSVQSVTWKKLQAVLKENKEYLTENDQMIGKISPDLARFAKYTADFVQTGKEEPFILRIPRSSALYWADAFYELAGYVPDVIKKLQNNLPEIETEFLKPEKDSKTAEIQDADQIINGPELPTPVIEEKKTTAEPKYRLSGELRSYQKEGVQWMQTMLKNRLNVILADEMGLGKTVQALDLLIEEMNKNPGMNAPSLVLCPSSLVDNWQMEASKFAPQLKTLIIRGTRRKQIMEQIIENDLVIASYAIAAREQVRLKEHKFHFLILDEAQHIKNPSTVNARTCKSLNANHKIVLTGTPLENSPEELWSIFDFLQPKMLGSMSVFKNRYSGIGTDENMQGDLASRTAPFILRRKKSEVEPDLPKKIVQTIYCEMNPEQRKLYNDFREKGLECFDSLVKSGKNSRFDLLTNLLRLRQICCHPTLLPVDNSQVDMNSAKTDLLQELLLESLDSGHKVLLFSQFTSFLAIIKKWLEKEKINFEYLDGSTKDRMEHVKNFNNNSEIPLFLLSLRAGGVGLNLTAADRVIIYDPWWNPAVEAQATDRTHRIGQTKSVYSMKLVVKNSIEEKILSLQQKKQRIFCNLVENKSASLKQLSDEDLEFLLT